MAGAIVMVFFTVPVEARAQTLEALDTDHAIAGFPGSVATTAASYVESERTQREDAELILEEARRTRQHLPLTLVQANLLRAAIALAGPDADSAAVIEAIRPSRAPSGAST